MKKIKIETIKTVVKGVIGLGISSVIDNVAKANLPGPAGKITKILCSIGSLGLGIIAAEQLRQAVDNQVDDWVEVLDSNGNVVLLEEVEEIDEEEA